MERWIGSSLCRELLDQMLILNAHHLRRVIAEYETHFNTHRPHRSLAKLLRSEHSLADTTDITIIRRDRIGGVIHEYMPVA
jgi:putative transposase